MIYTTTIKVDTLSLLKRINNGKRLNWGADYPPLTQVIRNTALRQ